MKRTKGQLRVATKVVLHIIVLVFVLAKSPQSSCCQPKCQLCGCVCVRISSRLDDACYRCEPSVHSAQLSVGFSVSFGIRLSFHSVGLSWPCPSSVCCRCRCYCRCCCQLANGILFAKHIRNFARTLSGRYLYIGCLCALELWAPVYYCGPIMIICLSSVPVH